MKTQLLIVLLILFTAEAFSQEIVNFSGTVKDSQTGKLLENINVFVTEKNTGTLTNLTGGFFIFIRTGIYDINFSGNGYKPEKITVDLSSDKISEIELTPTSVLKKKLNGVPKKKTTFSPVLIATKQKSKNGV
jgi:hypothetical protein